MYSHASNCAMTAVIKTFPPSACRCILRPWRHARGFPVVVSCAVWRPRFETSPWRGYVLTQLLCVRGCASAVLTVQFAAGHSFNVLLLSSVHPQIRTSLLSHRFTTRRLQLISGAILAPEVFVQLPWRHVSSCQSALPDTAPVYEWER